MGQLPEHVITVVDEAYMEFATAPDFPRMAELVGAGHRLIVTRTFSKLFGLASLRIGYAFGAPELMDSVRAEKLPFNSGIVPLLAAAAALGDNEHRERTLDMVVQGRQYFQATLPPLGVTVLPSEAFYVLLTDMPRPAAEVCDLMLARGMEIRHAAPFALPDQIRITIGRQEDNERIVAALGDILARGE